MNKMLIISTILTAYSCGYGTEFQPTQPVEEERPQPPASLPPLPGDKGGSGGVLGGVTTGKDGKKTVPYFTAPVFFYQSHPNFAYSSTKTVSYQFLSQKNTTKGVSK